MAIIYVPLEHIDQRYTTHLDRDIIDYLSLNYQYKRIYPDLETPKDIRHGSFLDSEFTIRFKTAQLSEIARLYREDEINSGDILFFSDIWLPGVESIAYMNYFSKKDVKITGVLHAGSFTDTDFVRDMERWAKNFEDIIFDISDLIFVGSNFIKNDVIKKRLVNPDKIVVSRLPIDKSGMKQFKTNEPKENIVIFNGRNVDEKQPWLFDELAKRIDAQCINTQKENLSKEEYYKLLNKSKVVVSYALQENFGYGIQEACFFDCHPVLPNRLVYPEFYPSKYLYDTFEQSVEMVKEALISNEFNASRYIVNNDPVEVWFENINSRFTINKK